MMRKAIAIWRGDIKEGKGTLTTESGVLRQTVQSFQSRFDNQEGTNPEELLAAAHAGCFTMALSNDLSAAGITPKKLEAVASITIDKHQENYTITKSHIDLDAEIPGIDKQVFDEAVNRALHGCPISKLLKTEITINSNLKA